MKVNSLNAVDSPGTGTSATTVCRAACRDMVGGTEERGKAWQRDKRTNIVTDPLILRMQSKHINRTERTRVLIHRHGLPTARAKFHTENLRCPLGPSLGPGRVRTWIYRGLVHDERHGVRSGR